MKTRNKYQIVIFSLFVSVSLLWPVNASGSYETDLHGESLTFPSEIYYEREILSAGAEYVGMESFTADYFFLRDDILRIDPNDGEQPEQGLPVGNGFWVLLIGVGMYFVSITLASRRLVKK